MAEDFARLPALGFWRRPIAGGRPADRATSALIFNARLDAASDRVCLIWSRRS